MLATDGRTDRQTDRQKKLCNTLIRVGAHTQKTEEGIVVDTGAFKNVTDTFKSIY